MRSSLATVKTPPVAAAMLASEEGGRVSGGIALLRDIGRPLR